MSAVGPDGRAGAGDPAGQYPPVVSEPLFLLDYDGTLAEITEDPARAHPHPQVAALLEALARVGAVYLLTGRGVRDLARLVRVPDIHVIGVHGLEEGVLTGSGEARDVGSGLGEAHSRLLDTVRESLPDVPGIRLEDKGSALALHYRGAPEPERVEEALLEWSGSLPQGVEVIWGKMLAEVRPLGFDKGRAALATARRHPGTTPVMIGDDTTDEDAFRALDEGVTVKVGAGPSAARFRLGSVDEVVAYLQRYVS